ncbi:MAG: pilus assembly protein [Hyphomicrobiaceae bacterium]
MPCPSLKSSLLSTAARARKALQAAVARLGTDRSGNIGMIFAFMIIPVVGVIGFSVDYGRALEERTALQTALDSAVLAAGREYQVSGDPDSAETAASDFFTAAMEAHENVEVVHNVADPENAKMTFTGKVRVRTTFARLLGVDEIEVSSTAEALLAKGGIDKDLEISLMLDVTGSMCQPCSKLEDLKDAAKDLINILVQDDQNEYTSRVALVPFSHAVNVGSEYFQAVTGQQQVVEDEFNYPASCYKNGKLKRSCQGNPDYLVVEGHNYSSCVVERAGSNKFTDAAPGSGNQTYLGIFDLLKANAVGSNTGCRPASRIVPLSDDKDGLNDAIDAFEADGWTAGQIGTAWSWYTLSPEWNAIWPEDSRAGAYDNNTMKIAVLMTDGEYNTAYQTGNGSSSAQAKQLCNKMKQAGITVYTVGFMVNATAKNLLEDCATSPSHFYNATDGDKLKLAFRSIAFNVAQLRLSK